MITRALLLSLLALLFCTACAAPRFPKPSPLAKDFTFLKAVDRAVARADCRNTSYYQIPDAPYLRTSRFWQAVGKAKQEDVPFRFWLKRLRDIDREIRQGELTCLDATTRQQLLIEAGAGHNLSLKKRIETSANNLYQHDLQQPADIRKILKSLTVPDDYSLWLRTFGVYPLSRIPIVIGVNNAYADRRQWFRQNISEVVDLNAIEETGPSRVNPLSKDEVAAIVAAARNNPLAVPLPDQKQTRQLVEHFAPIYRQEVKFAADHWGAISIDDENFTVTRDKVVYYYLDHQIIAGQPLLRINYVVWHPARTGDVVPWFERGQFDGITYGVVLAPDGHLVMTTTMNNCGCYLQFYPAEKRVDSIREKRFNPNVLAPQNTPQPKPSERVAITMTSGWHQVVRLEATSSDYTQQYELQPYSELEQLPAIDNRTRNLFDQRGVLVGTERAERFFFFGMGIPSVGSMRQRGHQPTTLLGREHYDDPDLLDVNFAFTDKALK